MNHICEADEIDYMRALAGEGRCKNNMFKKVMFYVGIVLAILAVFVATALQVLPFAIALILMGITIYGKKDLRLWIIVLSVIMLLINITPPPSFIDVIYWGLVIWAFARK